MLGAFRFVLACGVLFSHTSLFPDSFARTMVTAFFVVSGFLITLTIHRNYGTDLRSFYWNRVVRIFPLHWAVCAIVLVLWLMGYAGYVDKWGPTTATVAGSFLLLPECAGLLNAPAWTLTYEMMFFFLAPFLVWGGPRLIIATLFLCLSAIGLLRGLPLAFEPFLLQGIPGSGFWIRWVGSFSVSLLYFTGGMLLYFLSEQMAKRSLFSQALALLLLFGCFAVSYGSWATGWCFYPAVFWATLGATALLVVSWKGEVSGISFWMGELCYPVYLFHHFVINAITSQVPMYRSYVSHYANQLGSGREPKFFINAAGVLLITLTFSAIWLFIEHRWIRPLRAGGRKAKRFDVISPKILTLDDPSPKSLAA